MTPFMLLAHGRVLRRRGDVEEAERTLHAGLAMAADMGLRPWSLEILGSLAGIALELESHEEAVRILGGVDAQRGRDGFVAHLDPARVGDLARLQSALDAESLQAAWDEGAALSFDDLVAYARRGRGERKRPSSGWASLTPVETQVIELIREGRTNKEIGERLFVSVNTVRTHLAHVFTKLGVANRAELAAQATARRPR
jgi:DNA-binding CsgD family transcriptional regulator